MKLFPYKSSRDSAGRAEFDQLRAQVEAEVARPGVVAMTAASRPDAPGVAARGLAESLALAGYATLLIATSSEAGGAATMTLQDVAHSITPDATAAGPVVVSAGNSAQQRHVSRRAVQLAFETLRRKFDYVVVEASYENALPFATSVIAASDAVLVAVKAGRRERGADARLATALERDGVTFLGIVALDAKAIADAAPALGNGRIERPSTHTSNGNARPEVVDALVR